MSYKELIADYDFSDNPHWYKDTFLEILNAMDNAATTSSKQRDYLCIKNLPRMSGKTTFLMKSCKAIEEIMLETKSNIFKPYIVYPKRYPMDNFIRFGLDRKNLISQDQLGLRHALFKSNGSVPILLVDEIFALASEKIKIIYDIQYVNNFSIVLRINPEV